MHYLEDKNILFIAPSFHGLQNKIFDEMTRLGGNVDYYDERPKNDFFTKVSIRLKLNFLISQKIKNYYKNILKITEQKQYNYIFIINIEAMPEMILKKFKEQQTNAKLVLYMWDSLELKTISKNMLNLFDETFTFDYKDSEQRSMNFLDLFYTKEYENIAEKEIKYDFCFIGTIHGDRYELLNKIREQVEKEGMKVYYYLFMPSRIMFWMRKLFDKSFKKISYNEVKFHSLGTKNIVEVMNQSRVVIDLSYKNQRGLSMRTFEVLGAKKKLMTTHDRIKKYDFYCSNNIFIINKNLIEIDKDFLYVEYKELDSDIYKKYTLESWVKRILF